MYGILSPFAGAPYNRTLMARLLIHTPEGVRTVELGPVPVSFGRDATNTVPLLVPEASRQHFRIEETPLGFKLADLESRNGTRVNGRTVNTQLLKHGDQIEVGAITITFEDPDAKPAPAPAPKPESRPGSKPPSSIHEGSPKSTGRRGFRRGGDGPSPALFVAVGVAVAIIIGLIIGVSMIRPAPEVELGRQAFNTAVEMEERDPKGALAAYEKIPSSAGRWYQRAQERAGLIRKAMKAEPSDEEKAALAEYLAWIDQNAFQHDEIIRRGEDLLGRFGKGPIAAELQRHVDAARGARGRIKVSEVEEAEKEAEQLAGKLDYAGAVERLNMVRDKYRADLDLKDRLVRKHADLVARGRQHARDTEVEATRLKQAGKTIEARDLYIKLAGQLGNGKVAEFADQVRAATLNYESLK